VSTQVGIVTTERADRPVRMTQTAQQSSDFAVRELMAVREIAQAFLCASRPADVHQFALDRVSPLVGAALACVYVIDGDSELMRLAAAYNWPDRYARFLGDMRVRLGAGPSGTAAGERRVVEIPDVFADASIADWQIVAKELGFRSLYALPLETSSTVLGAVTFYFQSSGALPTEARDLLRVVADQMAATAEKAKLIEDLQQANGNLHQVNTELERQYVALLEARRLQDEFLSNVSHELRTPLTAVMGYLALMEEGLAGPVTSEQQHTLGQVKSSSERLLEIIGDLLDLTSLKRREVTMQVAEFDPREALREALACTNGRKAGVELIVEEASVLPMMKSDKRKVARLVSALVANAYKFTELGHVRVSVRVRDGRAVYSVTDTGVGISAEAQFFVFDEFRQEDGSATRKYGGSGLGLAIARRLAHMLGGEVSLSSEQGKGSTFVAELPLVLKDKP
jgi:signal transduction histidine kinase